MGLDVEQKAPELSPAFDQPISLPQRVVPASTTSPRGFIHEDQPGAHERFDAVVSYLKEHFADQLNEEGKVAHFRVGTVLGLERGLYMCSCRESGGSDADILLPGTYEVSSFDSRNGWVSLRDVDGGRVFTYRAFVLHGGSRPLSAVDWTGAKNLSGRTDAFIS